MTLSLNGTTVTKVHGSGNSFALIGDPFDRFELSNNDFRLLAVRLSGTDGLDTDGLLVLQSDPASGADVQMRMFNPDGSEAEICGNGLRCLARAAMEAMGRNYVVVRTLKATHGCCRVDDFASGVYTVAAAMGEPTFAPVDIPCDVDAPVIDAELDGFSDGLPVTVLGMPNPHVVAVVDEIDFERLTAMGTAANDNHPRFPSGSNVNFVRVIDRQAIEVATFERGAGLTNSCGSGMTAASVVAARLGHTQADAEVTVYNRGGFVRTKVSREGRATLTGNATRVSVGTLQVDADGPGAVRVLELDQLDEEPAYQDGVLRASQAALQL